MNLSRYYKSFVSLYGLVAALPFVPPILSLCVPYSSALLEYLYPPLGDAQNLTIFFTIIILVFTTYVVYILRKNTRKTHASVLVILLAGTALSVCVLIWLYVQYVRRVPIPSINSFTSVSIGYRRTDFALQTYPNRNDWDMLHDQGPWEDKIQKLWTPASIAVIRIMLWGFYTLTLTNLVSLVSLGVFDYAAEE